MHVSVLDHGFVELLDHMGNDNSVVEAARVSVGGARATSTDRHLIRYLMRMRHTSPFEMVEFKFRIKLPIFVARQMVRHRTASLNEVSARYTVLPSEHYSPPASRLAVQSDSNKQGSGTAVHKNAEEMADALAGEASGVLGHYHALCDAGLAREIARVNMPVSAYTVWIWKIDLHNLLHFLKLRLHPHAQEEIRAYAEAISEIIKIRVPVTWEAFEDYVLNAVTLTRVEQAMINMMIDRHASGAFAEQAKKKYSEVLTSREMDEFMQKLGRILKTR